MEECKMKREIVAFLGILIILGSFFAGIDTKRIDAQVGVNSLDAAQFVSNVFLEDSEGPLGTNKVSDSSSIKVIYELELGSGSNIDTSQPYTMTLPKELNYETSIPISLNTVSGIHLGDVTIKNGIISIQFSSSVHSLDNLKINFDFWSNFDKDELNYDTGNDLIFPIQNNPNHSIHVNFSKSSSGGGSGTSAISKSLTYDDADPTIVNWTVTVNNGGYAVTNSVFQDVMENHQDYLTGSMTINYRNWKKAIIKSEKTDPSISQNNDGSQNFSLSFGQLTSEDEKNDSVITSVVLHYQTKLLYNSNNNHYPNTATSFDGSERIDSALSTATYRGQGGGGEGDEIIDIKGKKIWEDQNNREQRRPKQITVSLLRNGINYREQVVSENSSNEWGYVFTSVPKYDSSGTTYTYTVKEIDVPEGYMSEVAGTIITNHYTLPESISVSGQKIWDDQENKDGNRPSNITVNLLANGLLKESRLVTAETGWRYQFKGLPKEENGQEISYSITEKPVRDYSSKTEGNNLINIYTPEKTSVSVQKIWEDENNQDGIRPKKVFVELYANRQKISEASLSAENEWKITWDELSKRKNGEEILYTVKERESISGYRASSVESHKGNFVLTNTHIPELIDVVGKKTWKDQNNRLSKRPKQITVQLIRNKKVIASKKVTQKDGWTYSFEKLAKFSNGKRINYSILELPVRNYTSEVKGYDLVNTYKNDGKAIHLDRSIQKTYEDNYSKSDLTGNSKFAINKSRYPNTGDKSNIKWILSGFVVTVAISGLYFIKKR